MKDETKISRTCVQHFVSGVKIGSAESTVRQDAEEALRAMQNYGNLMNENNGMAVTRYNRV